MRILILIFYLLFVVCRFDCRFASNLSSNQVKDAGKTHQEKAKALKTEENKAKKKEPPPIMLITDANNIVVMSLEDAGKLAKKKSLHLVEVSGESEHLKTDKQVYKLVTTAQFYGDDWRDKKGRGLLLPNTYLHAYKYEYS